MADRGRDPESVEREIELTRAELAQTIDALTDRLSPKRAARRSAVRARDAVGTLLVPVEGDDDEAAAARRRQQVVLIGAGVTAAFVAVVIWRRARR